MPPPPRLILASASPRRRELLHAAGYRFEVCPADIDESDHAPDVLPADLAEQLAICKADALAPRFHDDVILAADTVVALGDRFLNKPIDAADATAMLASLSGTAHHVVSGVAVLRPSTGFRRSTRIISAVHMRPMSTDEIERYVATNRWQGKAGGYGIQDDDPFVTRMTGSMSNIVGLPMEATEALLREAGIAPAD